MKVLELKVLEVVVEVLVRVEEVKVMEVVVCLNRYTLR